MENIYKKKLAEILLVGMLAVVMVRIPVTHYICLVNAYYYSNMAKITYRCAIVCIVIVMCVLLVYRKNIKLSHYELLFATIIGFQLLSCLNALSTQKAIWGESGRNEGILILLCYYLFFYTARLITSEKRRTAVIKIFLSVMTLHALYGIGQFYELTWLPFIHDYYHFFISGVAGNPNFMGSLMVMAWGMTAGMLIYTNNLAGRIIYAIILQIFTVALIYTEAMSAYLGLAVIVLAIFIIFVKQIYMKKGKKTALSMLAIFTVATVAVVIITDRLTYGVLSQEIISQLKNSINLETFASGRLLIWINIFRMLPEYLIFGVGIDGLLQPYYDRYGLLNGTYVDKAHNELIHILITMGLPVMICYIIFYYFIIKDIAVRIKSKKNTAVDIGLLFVIIGYLTQAMFNISVIDVAPYFWIMLGLAAKPLIEE